MSAPLSALDSMSYFSHITYIWKFYPSGILLLSYYLKFKFPAFGQAFYLGNSHTSLLLSQITSDVEGHSFPWCVQHSHPQCYNSWALAQSTLRLGLRKSRGCCIHRGMHGMFAELRVTEFECLDQAFPCGNMAVRVIRGTEWEGPLPQLVLCTVYVTPAGIEREQVCLESHRTGEWFLWPTFEWRRQGEPSIAHSLWPFDHAFGEVWLSCRNLVQCKNFKCFPRNNRGENGIQSPFRSRVGLLWLIVIITLADLTALTSYFLFEDSVFIISMKVPLAVSRM